MNYPEIEIFIESLTPIIILPLLVVPHPYLLGLRYNKIIIDSSDNNDLDNVYVRMYASVRYFDRWSILERDPGKFT